MMNIKWIKTPSLIGSTNHLFFPQELRDRARCRIVWRAIPQTSAPCAARVTLWTPQSTLVSVSVSRMCCDLSIKFRLRLFALNTFVELIMRSISKKKNRKIEKLNLFFPAQCGLPNCYYCATPNTCSNCNPGYSLNNGVCSSESSEDVVEIFKIILFIATLRIQLKMLILFNTISILLFLTLFP